MSGEASPLSQDPAPTQGVQPRVADTLDSAPAGFSPEGSPADAADPSSGSGPASGETVPSQPVDPAQRLQELESELEALRTEHESLRGQYMRIAADFDNFRKRQSRDQDDLRLQITCSTLSEILPVVDNFDRARHQLDPQTQEAQDLHRSYQGLYKQLVDVFKQLGVSPMRVEGEAFDPNLHEAVLREPSDEVAEDLVIAELQRGYHLNGRVLRHALVKVSMGPGPSAGAEATAQSHDGPSSGEESS